MWRRPVVYIAGSFIATTLVHAGVGRGTHPLHLVHVVFGAVYLVPIVAAAVWLGARAAVGLAFASAAVYVVHSRTAWAGDAMENVNQLTMAGVYLFVGAVSAALVSAAERERRGRVEAERTAQREALVQGIATLSGALRQRDDGTAAHCERVARVATLLGSALGLAPARLDVVRLASLAHDVGKIGGLAIGLALRMPPPAMLRLAARAAAAAARGTLPLAGATVQRLLERVHVEPADRALERAAAP